MSIIDKVLARITPIQWTQSHRRMGIASMIADAMEAKGLTQAEFAKLIGKKASKIPLMLSGHYNYTIEELTQIEFALDTPLFFSKELGWWMPDKTETKTYTTEFEPLLEAADPSVPYAQSK
jgi:transcriptional regulator with XRE-family HTH domain